MAHCPSRPTKHSDGPTCLKCVVSLLEYQYLACRPFILFACLLLSWNPASSQKGGPPPPPPVVLGPPKPVDGAEGKWRGCISRGGCGWRGSSPPGGRAGPNGDSGPSGGGWARGMNSRSGSGSPNTGGAGPCGGGGCCSGSSDGSGGKGGGSLSLSHSVTVLPWCSFSAIVVVPG